MPIKFACPTCGKGYNVKDELAGKKAKCSCGATMPIPNDVPATAPVSAQTATGDSLFDKEFPSIGTNSGAPLSHQASYSPLDSPATGSYADSISAVGSIENDSAAASEASPLGASVAFLLGVGLSGGGAMLGAVVWAVIAIMTGFEIGWIALGIGYGAGFGMAIAHNMSGSIAGPLAGVVASVMAVLGVLAAKVAVYVLLVGGVVPFAMMFGPMDALFFLLAIATAFRLGSGSGDDD